MKRITHRKTGSKSTLQAGITLIEVVIVMGILALAIIPIYNNIFGHFVFFSYMHFVNLENHVYTSRFKLYKSQYHRSFF